MDRMNRSGRKNEELVTTLCSVIKVLEDSQRGMASLGEHLQDPTLRRHFLMESLRRANFRGELENILHQHGVTDVYESGTAAAAMYRAWASLQSALGAADDTLMNTADEAEHEVRDAYRTALQAELPVQVRQTLVEQQTHILMAADYLREQQEEPSAA